MPFGAVNVMFAPIAILPSSTRFASPPLTVRMAPTDVSTMYGLRLENDGKLLSTSLLENDELSTIAVPAVCAPSNNIVEVNDDIAFDPTPLTPAS